VADAEKSAGYTARSAMVQGHQNGLRSVIDAMPDRFFALYADNVRRHGTPALQRYFATLRRVFADCERSPSSTRAATDEQRLSFYFRGGAAVLCG
jgi:hypothetical protein